MTQLFDFLKWLITYAVEGKGFFAFIHFIAVVWVVGVIARVTTLVSVSVSTKSRKGLSQKRKSA